MSHWRIRMGEELCDGRGERVAGSGGIVPIDHPATVGVDMGRIAHLEDAEPAVRTVTLELGPSGMAIDFSQDVDAKEAEAINALAFEDQFENVPEELDED